LRRGEHSERRPVSAISVRIVSAATISPESCVRAPADPLTAVFERLPLTTMPLREPGGDVRAAESERLAVGVDLVVLTQPVAAVAAQRGKRPAHHRLAAYAVSFSRASCASVAQVGHAP
jgi:hypothetical protein